MLINNIRGNKIRYDLYEMYLLYADIKKLSRNNFLIHDTKYKVFYMEIERIQRSQRINKIEKYLLYSLLALIKCSSILVFLSSEYICKSFNGDEETKVSIIKLLQPQDSNNFLISRDSMFI